MLVAVRLSGMEPKITVTTVGVLAVGTVMSVSCAMCVKAIGEKQAGEQAS